MIHVFIIARSCNGVKDLFLKVNADANQENKLRKRKKNLH